MDTKLRQRWADKIGRKEPPPVYDDYRNESQKEPSAATKPSQGKTRRNGSTAGLSVAAPGTVSGRNELQQQELSIDQDRARQHVSRDPRFASTTSTPVAGTSSNTMQFSSPSSPARVFRSSRKEQGDKQSVETNGTQRSPNTRSVSSEALKGKGMLGRRSSRSNNEALLSDSSPSPAFDQSRTISSSGSSRPRTRTLDDRKPFERSSGNASQRRQRMGSVNTPSASSQVRGAEFLASVPAVTAPPRVPSISSFAVPVQRPSDTNIDTTAMASMSAGSNVEPHTLVNSLPKRIQHLMKALNGRMSGMLIFRRNGDEPWFETYCFIDEADHSLICESRSGDRTHRTLLADLRGVQLQFGQTDDHQTYIIARTLRTDQQAHIRANNQTDFDSWIAVLFSWQIRGPQREHALQIQHRNNDISPAVAPPPVPRRASARSISPESRQRVGSDLSQRRKSVISSLKEAPVIKIGKMIFWDTDVTHTAPAPPVVGSLTSGRPQAQRMQSYGSRRWRRISALLRENGELKLHADVDNSLLSVVQLSQLSRCAIQRLDQSVLENEFCIAIYPQYTSTPTDNATVLRPIFLSLESRVLHEVWFVLLRAFTIPQLYGPRLPDDLDEQDAESNKDFEKLLAEQTTDMFRMERFLSIRIVEAKIYPNTPSVAEPMHTLKSGLISRPEVDGYHVELLLDNEIRAKTTIKYEGMNPLWGETFEFADLPPVLTSASIVIKRRPPDQNRSVPESGVFTSEAHGGFSGISLDSTCGKVEIYLDELASMNEAEKWWPVVNMFNQRVGEVLVKARADEGVVLMARDYQPLNNLLHKFTNGLSLQLAQIVPGELKRLSDCLLNIYQVSGKAGDWIMALVEDEIDSIHKETPITRLRYAGRIGSDASNDHLGSGGGHSDRELMVRDMNKNATLEANLLFRGNTLLTKSLDSHMRRVGKDFLEDALAVKLKEICTKDPDCEVDPNRAPEHEVNRNWRRLIALTSEVWKSIIAAKHKCPIELRRIFRHIRACAEDRYGDFLRSVSYSSVSGFLFLRFFCPAVLNPKLFGLFKDDIKPKGRRTLTLIAKSLQTLANMASFGTKEQWMEPMNIFLSQSREPFKTFIDDICYVPAPVPSKNAPDKTPAFKIISADTNLSYTTPMTIAQRLPPTSREGFPSLPYLIDQPRAFAELVQLWLETTSDASSTRDMAFPGKSKADLLAAIRQTDGDVRAFHDICVKLNARTQECLSRAERAERPHSALSFQWEELIDQLQSPTDEMPDVSSSFAGSADRNKTDASIAEPSVKNAQVEQLIGSLRLEDGAGTPSSTRTYTSTPDRPQPSILQQHNARSRGNSNSAREEYRNGSSNNIMQSRTVPSRSSTSPASPMMGVTSSSATSSDNEYARGTTALPSYEREILHRRQEAEQQDRQKSEHGEKRTGIKFVSALRKKRTERDLPGSRDGSTKSP